MAANSNWQLRGESAPEFLQAAGTGGNIGAEKMLAHRLQQACRTGDSGLAAQLAAELDAAAGEAGAAIRQWIDGIPLQASA